MSIRSSQLGSGQRKTMGDVGCGGLLTAVQCVIDGLSSCYDSMSDLRDLRGTGKKKPLIILFTTTSY